MQPDARSSRPSDRPARRRPHGAYIYRSSDRPRRAVPAARPAVGRRVQRTAVRDRRPPAPPKAPADRLPVTGRSAAGHHRRRHLVLPAHQRQPQRLRQRRHLRQPPRRRTRRRQRHQPRQRPAAGVRHPGGWQRRAGRRRGRRGQLGHCPAGARLRRPPARRRGLHPARLAGGHPALQAAQRPVDHPAAQPDVQLGLRRRRLAHRQPRCSQNTVETMTGLRHHTIVIDFKGFAAMTSAVGGVQVCVPTPVDGYGIHLARGRQTLSGQLALDYVRARQGSATARTSAGSSASRPSSAHCSRRSRTRASTSPRCSRWRTRRPARSPWTRAWAAR